MKNRGFSPPPWTALAAGCLMLAGGGVALAQEPTGAANGVVIGAIPPDQPARAPNSGIGLPALLELVQAASGFTVRDVDAAAGGPISLPIEAGARSSDYTFVMIKGLPAGFKLSAGFQTKDAWAVALRDLAGLSMIAPAAYSGAFSLDVMLIKGRDVAPDSRKITVNIRAAGAGQPVPAAASRNPQIAAAAPPSGADPLQLKDDDLEEKTGLVPTPPPGVSEAEETALLQRASMLLKSSDIAASRLLFEHLAMRGSAKAAFAMGQTYDPDFLKTLFVRGLTGEVDKAKAWYRKAMDLGNPEARRRLSALGE